MSKGMTVTEFFQRFPDDETCLNHLFHTKFGDDPKCPQCGGDLHRLRKMPAWTCNNGHHVHPMKDTPFERTRTPLQKWFYAMFLFTTTRNGVAAKELQRQLGVTYKTAWRMGHEIRKYMGEVDGDWPLDGHVEMDEVFVGGVNKGRGVARMRENKTIVFGMVQRGGDLITEIMHPAPSTAKVFDQVLRYVRRGSTVNTDEARYYEQLGENGYNHVALLHRAKEYVRGEHHTNTIEGFWSMLQRSIRGTHIHVSGKHLDKYLQEFEFRFNLRSAPELMFPRLLASFGNVPHPRASGVLPFAR